MRRLLVAAALAAVCATATACTSDSADPVAGGSSAPAAAGSASDPARAVSDDTERVCAAAEQVITDGTSTFSGVLTDVVAASAKNDSAARKRAVTAMHDLLTRWVLGLREQAGLAVEAELRAALTDMADQLEKVDNGIRTFDDLRNVSTLLDTPEMAAAGQRLDQLCG